MMDSTFFPCDEQAAVFVINNWLLGNRVRLAAFVNNGSFGDMGGRSFFGAFMKRPEYSPTLKEGID